MPHHFYFESHRGSVSIVARLRAGRKKNWSLISGGSKGTSLSTALGPTQPPIQWVPAVKRMVREADHSPLSNAKVYSAIRK
jgi:hypothetical protein